MAEKITSMFNRGIDYYLQVHKNNVYPVKLIFYPV